MVVFHGKISYESMNSPVDVTDQPVESGLEGVLRHHQDKVLVDKWIKEWVEKEHKEMEVVSSLSWETLRPVDPVRIW